MRFASQKSKLGVTFKPGDRVCRRIPGHANKLQYLYSGPYRVEEAISATRYRLRDLENRQVKDEVHISNLRPYFTVTDSSPLAEDEYLVEELLDRKGDGVSLKYLVKWRGYPRSEATWESRIELLRRCADLVESYDTTFDRRPVQPQAHSAVDSSSSPSSSPQSNQVPRRVQESNRIPPDLPSSRTRSRSRS